MALIIHVPEQQNKEREVVGQLFAEVLQRFSHLVLDSLHRNPKFAGDLAVSQPVEPAHYEHLPAFERKTVDRCPDLLFELRYHHFLFMRPLDRGILTFAIRFVLLPDTDMPEHIQGTVANGPEQVTAHGCRDFQSMPVRPNPDHHLLDDLFRGVGILQKSICIRAKLTVQGREQPFKVGFGSDGLTG